MGVIITALLIVLGVASFGFNQFQRAFHGNVTGFVTTLFMITGVTVICLVGERTFNPVSTANLETKAIPKPV